MELQATPTINVLIEINTYLIAVVLVHIWRQQPHFGFFKTELYLDSQALVIVMPHVAMMGLLGYLWPSLNIIFPSVPKNINQTNNQSAEGGFCDQKNN